MKPESNEDSMLDEAPSENANQGMVPKLAEDSISSDHEWGGSGANDADEDAYMEDSDETSVMPKLWVGMAQRIADDREAMRGGEANRKRHGAEKGGAIGLNEVQAASSTIAASSEHNPKTTPQLRSNKNIPRTPTSF